MAYAEKDDEPTTGKTDDDEILEEALECFRLSLESEQENRDSFIADMKFSRLGEQWPASVKAAREAKGRPCLTFNRFPSFLRQVINDARQNKPVIKCHPVDSGSDVETSEILDGLVRNIEQSSNADVAYDTAIDFAASGGIGYIRVNTEYASDDTFDLDIRIERISNPLTVYGDHLSTAADSSDWNYAFITDLMPKEDFKSKYPKAEKTAIEAVGDERDAAWFEDGGAVRISEYWKREEVEKQVYKLSNGQVIDDKSYEQLKEILDGQQITIAEERSVNSHKITQYIMTGAEILETNDWPGKFIPIIPVYGDEIWIEGKRYWQSLIHHAKDAQQAYNYWRTSAIEKVALDTKSPWIGPKGAFNTDTNKWATANTDNHAYLEYDGNISPQRIHAGGVPAGDLQMALNASDDMKSIMGIHDASLGARSNETSGVAIRARKMEGDVSTFHFIDNLSRAIRHTGRVVIDLIPKVFSAPRIIRTLAEDGTPDMVQVNQETLIKGLPKIYDLTAGKYDVTVSSGPSFTSKREESAVQMTDLIRAYPEAAPLIGDLLAKNLDWPGADEIAKRFKSMLPPQILNAEEGKDPQVAQLQQQMEQMKQQGMQVIQQTQQQAGAEIQKLQAENQQLKQSQAADQAKFQLDAQQMQHAQMQSQAQLQLDAQRIQIEQYKAESDRMKAESDKMKTETDQLRAWTESQNPPQTNNVTE